MPGSVTVVLPTVIASEATTKNQPPDIDIIVFQIRPGMANGTSSRQKRCQPREVKALRRLVEVVRHVAQRLVHAEGHVPGLAGEDREDAASSAPSTRPGNRFMKNTTVKVRKPRIGTDCRMSSSGISTISARRLLAARAA